MSQLIGGVLSTSTVRFLGRRGIVLHGTLVTGPDEARRLLW
jgi:hypothetical protein